MGGGKSLITKRLKTKQQLKLFLLFAFLFSLPLVSQAQTYPDTVHVNGIIYSIQNSSGSVTAIVKGAASDFTGKYLNIPLMIPVTATINGTTIVSYATVTGIEIHAFEYGAFGGSDIDISTIITSINIPSSIKGIGIEAFPNFSALKSITVAEGSTLELTNIYNAFAGSSNLKYLSFKGQSYIVLKNGVWNYVSGVGNTASLYNQNIPWYYASDFTVDESVTDVANSSYPHCDIAIFTYDYDNNNWSSDGLYANSTMYSAAGYFVWPFYENNAGTTIVSSEDADIYKAFVSVPYSPITDATRNISNTNRTSTPPYYFAYGNPFSNTITIDNFTVTQGTIQGSCLYTYNRNNGSWSTTQDSVYPGEGFMVAVSNMKTFIGRLTNPSSTNNSLPANITKSIEEQNKWGITFSCLANGMN
ncbi:MAG: hypothetical protein Q4Q06_05395, partial [Bacteroidota bacterium]|nr:hypothetical protein [Bacteroidota bacterium]